MFLSWDFIIKIKYKKLAGPQVYYTADRMNLGTLPFEWLENSSKAHFIIVVFSWDKIAVVQNMSQQNSFWDTIACLRKLSDGSKDSQTCNEIFLKNYEWKLLVF